jgi:uncharacterized membrane protein YcaP (DUF421 family)
LIINNLNIGTNYSGISTELIYDGIIFDQNLKQVNLDRKWLETELKRKGINNSEEVFLATLNTQGELYIDKYEDHINKLTDISDYPGQQ